MDFQGIIQRLRPYSPYLLKDGGGALYSDILEWRDPNTTKPTEAECNIEWGVMLAVCHMLQVQHKNDQGLMLYVHMSLMLILR